MTTIQVIKVIGLIIFLLHYIYRMNQLKHGLIQRRLDALEDRKAVTKLNDRLTDLESMFRQSNAKSKAETDPGQDKPNLKEEMHPGYVEFLKGNQD
jgi:hypothetical protein